MDRRTARRVALAASGLLALTACVVNLSFDMLQTGLPLQAPGAGAVSLQPPVLIDLGSYSEVRDHQKDIESLDLESVDVTITSIKAANLAQTLSLGLSVQKDLQDPSTNVKIGDIDPFTARLNATRKLQGNPSLDAFLLERLHDGGKFYLLIAGTTDDRTDIALDANLHASMGYNSGLF